MEINILYLLKILNTENVLELVNNIDAPALDINLAIWDSIDRGEIELNEEKSVVKLLKEPIPTGDPDLEDKILRTMNRYASDKTNITRSRLNSQIKDFSTGKGYLWHEYLMSLQHLIDSNQVISYELKSPEIVKKFRDKKGKPKSKVVCGPQTFIFLGLSSNKDCNEEWNKKTVDKFVSDMEKSIVK